MAPPHQLARQPASEEPVLGDFSGQQIDTDTERPPSFCVRGDEYYISQPPVKTAATGFQGRLQRFGLSRCNKYFLNALNPAAACKPTACWDTQQQAWFPLYQGEGRPSGPLHWTAGSRNANFCASKSHNQ